MSNLRGMKLPGPVGARLTDPSLKLARSSWRHRTERHGRGAAHDSYLEAHSIVGRGAVGRAGTQLTQCSYATFEAKNAARHCQPVAHLLIRGEDDQPALVAR